MARLDVAMFNAILRQSATETPTDPVSDPISDPTVLPIPAGKSSFGSGAQLKNTVSNNSQLGGYILLSPATNYIICRKIHVCYLQKNSIFITHKKNASRPHVEYKCFSIMGTSLVEIFGHFFSSFFI